MANAGKYLSERKQAAVEATKRLFKTKGEYDRLAKDIANFEKGADSARSQLATMKARSADMEARSSSLVGRALEAIQNQIAQLQRAIALKEKELAEKLRSITVFKQKLLAKDSEVTACEKRVAEADERVAKAEKQVKEEERAYRKEFQEYNDKLNDMVEALDGIDEDIAKRLEKKKEDPSKKLKDDLKGVNKEIKDLNKGFIRRWADDKISNLRVVKAYKWVGDKLNARKEKQERLAELQVRKDQLEATGKLRVAIEHDLRERKKEEASRRKREKDDNEQRVESLRRGGAKAIAEAYAGLRAGQPEAPVPFSPKPVTPESSFALEKGNEGTRKSKDNTTPRPTDTAAETQLDKALLNREVNALEKIAKAAEAGITGGKGKKGEEKKGLLSGIADWKAGWEIGKKLLPLLGRVAVGAVSVAAAAYGAYRAYGEVKKLWTGEDENGKKLDDFDKAKSVANLAVQGSLTTIGYLLGGPQGAALAAGIAPLLMDGVNMFGNMLAESSIGPIIGRGIALIMDPLTELPKLWKDQAAFISESIGKVAAMAASFLKPAKDAIAGTYNKAVEAGSKAIETTVNAAKSVGSTAANVWNTIKGTAAEVPGATKAAASKVSETAGNIAGAVGAGAATVGKVAVQAAAPVAAAASSVGATVGAGVSAAAETVKQGFSSISDAAGKLFRPAGGVDMEGLQPAVKQNFLGMAQDYKDATGKMLPVNSGFRSRQKQEEEYKKDPNKAAKPGTSPHERGIAIDTNSEDGNRLESLGLLSKWGFSRPAKTKAGKPELWHLQVAGTARRAAALGYNNGDFQDNTSVVSKATETGAASEAANQTKPTTRVATEQPAVQQPAAKSAEQPKLASGHPAGGGPANNSPKMSVESVPIFSYSDPTFFALNLSALA